MSLWISFASVLAVLVYILHRRIESCVDLSTKILGVLDSCTDVVSRHDTQIKDHEIEMREAAKMIFELTKNDVLHEKAIKDLSNEAR